jgi:hypothetical protein
MSLSLSGFLMMLLNTTPIRLLSSTSRPLWRTFFPVRVFSMWGRSLPFRLASAVAAKGKRLSGTVLLHLGRQSLSGKRNVHEQDEVLKV